MDRDFLIKRLNYSSERKERVNFRRKRRKTNSRVQVTFVQSTVNYFLDKNDSGSEFGSDDIEPMENSLFTILEQENFIEKAPKEKTTSFRKKSIKIKIDSHSNEKIDEIKSPAVLNFRTSTTPLAKKEFEEESGKIKRFGAFLTGEEKAEDKSPVMSKKNIAFEEEEKRRTLEKRRTSLFYKLSSVAENPPMFIYDFEEAANFKQYFRENNKDSVISKVLYRKKSSRKRNKERKLRSKNNTEALIGSQNMNEIKLV